MPAPTTQAVPDYERRRLDALRRYDILDTPPDGAFDRITSLVAEVLDVPVAVVSLVDEDRIWFKSRHGLDAEQVGRDPGLCASAIFRDGAYVLGDASADPHALANPLVAGELGVRFYAGVPLRTQSGYGLGMLAAIDVKPRDVTDRQLRILQDLAQVVMDQMELRLAARRVSELHGELQRAYGELSVRASRDALTGIANRDTILDILEKGRALAIRQQRPLALMVADIDDFKGINDTLGHAAGDRVLREVSHRLQRTARSSDSVGRLGGDEFLVVMYPCELEHGYENAERIRAAVCGVPIDVRGDGGEVRRVTVSVGVHCTHVAADLPADVLLRRADAALYAAKRQGRDRTSCFEADGVT